MLPAHPVSAQSERATAIETRGSAVAAAHAVSTCYDLLVVGGTPGGIAMAVRAARGGATVALVNHHAHLGGMLSSGLGVWNTRYEGKRAPFYDAVRQGIFDYYGKRYGERSQQYQDSLPTKTGQTNGQFESHVAERVLTDLVAAESKITVFKGFYPVASAREGAVVQSVTFRELGGKREVTLKARIFADCSYEADLLPLAGVKFRLGRESRAEFGEPHAGVIFMGEVDAPPTPEAARAGKLQAKLNLRRFPGFQVLLAESTGKGDDNVQAANYRTILTENPANRVPIPKPENQDPDFLRSVEMRPGNGPIPNGKVGLNRPQLIGPDTRSYAEGDWTVRRRVMDEHWQLTMAALWHYQNDPAATEEERGYRRKFGFPKDEFPDNGQRPYEIYFREGRRLIGGYTYTQRDVTLYSDLPCTPAHTDSIAMIEWYVDPHPCTTHRAPGSLGCEGKAMLYQESFPGQLPYRTIVPEGVANLLVPVNASSTHVAWNTIRLEPTWMQIGESAAHAVLQALATGRQPADIDTDKLVRTLAENHFMLAFFNDIDVSVDDPEIVAAQYFATKGFFAGYDALLAEPVNRATAMAWSHAFKQLPAGGLETSEVQRRVHVANAERADSVSGGEFLRMLGRHGNATHARNDTALTRGQALRTLWDSLPPAMDSR